jgi:hypothetical protein
MSEIVGNNRDGTGGLLANLEVIAKFAAGVILALYVLGLLAINGYLFSLGASDFSLLRPRFVYTGALIGLSAIVFILIPRSLIKEIRGSPDVSKRIRILWVLIGLLIPIFLPYLLLFTDSSISIRNLLLSDLALLVAGLVYGRQVSRLSMWRIIRQNEYMQPIMHGRLANSMVLLLLFTAMYVTVFMLIFFPKIPVQFGGGKPTQVALLIRHDEVDGIRALGLPIEKRSAEGAPRKQGATPGTGSVTTPLDLMYEGSEAYVIRLSDGTLVRINKNAIIAVKASKEGR